jgi:hypothetical protein
MKYSSRLGGVVLAVALCSFGSGVRAATLYGPDVNVLDAMYGVGTGSFELGSFADAGNGYMRVAAGSSAVSGWTVGGAGVDWLTAPVCKAADGMKSLDLAAQTAGWVETTIETIRGNQYSVAFDAYGGQIANRGKMTFGNFDALYFSPAPVAEAGSATYQHFVFNFIADSDSAVLRFEAANSDGFGPVIDNVVVTDPPTTDSVPEPASFGMASLLALSFGALLKRRQQA